MSFSVGSAASSPLALWQQLLQTGGAGTSQSQSFDPLASLMQTDAGDTSSPASSSGASASSTPPFGQGMMAQLIALQQQASAATGSGTSGADPGDAKFFAKLDTNGDGSVSQSEFEAAASKHGVSTSIADAVFAKIDGNGDGNVSQSELAAADKGRGHHGHHHAAGGTGRDGDADDLMSGSGADGSTTQSVTNPDGSTTTTITYADGSKVDMTSPAAASTGNNGSNNAGANGSSNKSSLNLIEQLIKLQSQAIGAATSALSVVA
ncbi:MAG TPA: EF-hand domain-containing protein [Pseudolabrys sp.]|nr:EF-hand domain-containing protein [Pseudolabrys sp.]